MDEMSILPGKGTADDPQALMRDPVGWRAAVFGRLGTTVIETTFIEQHQLQEMAFLKKRLLHLRWEAKARAFELKPSNQLPQHKGEQKSARVMLFCQANQPHCLCNQSHCLSCGTSG